MANPIKPFAHLLANTFLHLGTPGTYRRADGAEVATRFITKSSDVVEPFGNARLVMATHRFDVLSRDVPDPQAGDRFTLDGQTYQVVGEPMADRDRLVWTLTGAPA